MTRASRHLVGVRDEGSSGPARVLIAGGGFAAVEAILALRALAAEETQVTLLSPDPALRYRPAATLDVANSAPARAYDLQAIAHDAGVRYRRDRLEAVEPEAHRVRTANGQRLGYDALILATGARAVAGVPGALLFRDHRDAHLILRTLEEIEAGKLRSIAFVVPSGHSWPLPAYELALLCARQSAADAVQISLVTPERMPLEVFGPRASGHVADLLSRRRIRFMGNATAGSVHRNGTLALAFDGSVAADRVVAVPTLRGRRITGVPAGWWGFVPVDALGHVEGLRDVYAAGDMTAFPVKHGGLATQQADQIAHGLAESLGAPVRELHGTHVLQAVLAGDERPLLLRTELDWQGQPTVATLERIGQSRAGRLTKVFGRYLTPYLENVEPAAA